jgi:ATP-dependent RNA helicase SUPV3L1/SUV3
LDKGIWKEGYRVAGYRACGERVVRVDVVERLAGMIRAAIAGEAPAGADGPPSPRSPKGFVVSGAMTSLTGCSGEQFATILRSMGFRSVEMKRSDFFGSRKDSEATPQSALPEAAQEVQGPTGDEQAPPTVASDEEGAPADADLAPPAAARADDGLAGSERPDSLGDGADRVSEDAEAIAEAAGGAPEEAAGVTDGVTLETTTSPVLSDLPDGASAAEGIEQAASPPTSGQTCELTTSADVIVVWQPDHRKISARRERQSKQPRSEGPDRQNAPGPSPVATPNRRREAPTSPASKRPDRPHSARVDEKRRQRAKDYDMARSASTTATQQRAKVDPNSPFAKLLELRSRLEEQANKRQ